MSPHSLRHAKITNALDAGVPLRDAQILARHADPPTTEHNDRAAETSTDTASTSSPPTSLECERPASHRAEDRKSPGSRRGWSARLLAWGLVTSSCVASRRSGAATMVNHYSDGQDPDER